MRTAVIFAGGKSSRMGRDKAFLPFMQSTLIEYQYKKLCAIFDRVYISTKADKFDFDASFIYDSHDTFSPAVALRAVLKQLSCDEVFAISVDVPFIKQEDIYTLYSAKSDHEIVAAKTQGGVQPLCAIYSKSILPKLEAMLEKDIHKLNFLIKQCDSKLVDFEDEQSFLNLNHPHEYELALSKTQRFK
ncbi:MAG: molybdenum cofactor guanylyltransferase MobA [Campylobacterota bacterium]